MVGLPVGLVLISDLMSWDVRAEEAPFGDSRVEEDVPFLWAHMGITDLVIRGHSVFGQGVWVARHGPAVAPMFDVDDLEVIR